MNGHKVWTADEMERMAPDERSRLFNERVVTDLSTLPPEFVARIRAKVQALLAERGIVPPKGEPAASQRTGDRLVLPGSRQPART